MSITSLKLACLYHTQIKLSSSNWTTYLQVCASFYPVTSPIWQDTIDVVPAPLGSVVCGGSPKSANSSVKLEELTALASVTELLVTN
jgi:hypothetical protein